MSLSGLEIFSIGQNRVYKWGQFPHIVFGIELGLNPNSKMVAESMIMIVVGFIKPQDVQTSVRGGVIDSTLTSGMVKIEYIIGATLTLSLLLRLT